MPLSRQVAQEVPHVHPRERFDIYGNETTIPSAFERRWGRQVHITGTRRSRRGPDSAAYVLSFLSSVVICPVAKSRHNWESDLVYRLLAGPPLLARRVNNFVSRGADPAVGGPDNSGAFALLFVDFLFVISHEKREECRRDWAGQSRNRDSVASTFPAKD